MRILSNPVVVIPTDRGVTPLCRYGTAIITLYAATGVREVGRFRGQPKDLPNHKLQKSCEDKRGRRPGLVFLQHHSGRQNPGAFPLISPVLTYFSLQLWNCLICAIPIYFCLKLSKLAQAEITVHLLKSRIRNVKV